MADVQDIHIRQDIHVMRSSCVLCRQPPTAGTRILDLSQNQLEVPECKGPCLICNRAPNPRAWFHVSCYDILMITYQPSEGPTGQELGEFADATSSFGKSGDKGNGEIASIFEGLSSEYARRITEADFRYDLFMQLPMEIKVMIAELIFPCWYLKVLGETRRLIEQLRSLRHHEDRREQLELTQNVWVRRTIYRGIAYVAWLSTLPLKATATSTVDHIKIPDTVDKIVLSADLIGIRGVQFVDNNSQPQTDGSPWYEILEPKAPGTEIKVISDGLFMRYIQLISQAPAFNMFWSSPCPPKFQPWNFYSVREKPRLNYLRFDAQVRGLLVCCANGRMAGIHGFSGISKKFKEFVELMHQRMKSLYKNWIYFPFNRGESINGAWVRKSKICRGPASDPVLVLQTSLGRTVTFGPHFTTRLNDVSEYIPLFKDSDGPISGLFDDGLDPVFNFVFEFGVTCSRKSQGRTSDLMPMDDTRLEPPPLPRGGPSPKASMTWYMTKASLNGLVKAQIFRSQDQSHHPISGLLLFFNDEHVESLGQVRWDWDVGEEVFMPIFIERGTIEERRYIKNIQNRHDPGIDIETGEWQKLPKCGTVVWWFGRYGDQITAYDEENI